MGIFEGTPPFERIALLVAMHLNIARISFFTGTFFWGMAKVPANDLTPMKIGPGVAG